MTRTIVAVPTCRRPKMLAACLESLFGQCRLPTAILVVDNSEDGSARDIVRALERWAGDIDLRYHHEPRRGIAAARNAALRHAQVHAYDVLAWIDDDQVAATDWLEQLLSPEYAHVPILTGVVRRTIPTPAPFWAMPVRENRRPEGELVSHCEGGCVRINRDVIATSVEFDEELGLMGGEDYKFYHQHFLAGIDIRRTKRAVVTELVHRSRLTYRGQMYRNYWQGASDALRVIDKRGRTGAALRKIPAAFVEIPYSLAEIVLSPVFGLIGPHMFKRRALAGGKRIARKIGQLAAIAGHVPQPYRQIDGQ